MTAELKRMSKDEIDLAIAKRIAAGDEDGAALISAIVQHSEDRLAEIGKQTNSKLDRIAVALDAANVLTALLWRERVAFNSSPEAHVKLEDIIHLERWIKQARGAIEIGTGDFELGGSKHGS
jgi:hypothetical protein